MVKKRDWFYPTAFSVWGDEELDAIERVRKSGQFTMGPEVEAFEEEFAKYHSRKHGVMVNSGSSANLIMVAALFHVEQFPLQRGDMVEVPALAWSTTYAPLVQYGLQMRLLDCDDTWNANTLDKTNLVAPGWNQPPRLVVGCSILGNPAKLDILKSDASSCHAYFIEDNCESFDARLNVRKGNVWVYGDYVGLCGTYGLMSSFSFFYSHQISAVEGGMILTDDDELNMLCRKLRAHGWTRDTNKPEKFSDEYDFEVFGYNVRPVEMHAAIAREQLRKQKAHKKLRQRNAEYFRSLLGSFVRHPTISGDINPFGLAFCVHPDERPKLVAALRENDIDCRLPTGGSLRLHKYGMNYRSQKTPNVDFIHNAGLFLGNGALDLSAQIEKAVAVIKQVL